MKVVQNHKFEERFMNKDATIFIWFLVKGIAYYHWL
jgi:hypothetical protein